jgi:hypothetical protein
MYAVLCDIAGNSRDSEPILLVFAVISGRHSVTAHAARPRSQGLC